MASIGAVQATFDIDARKGIASLDSLAKSAKNTDKSLRDLSTGGAKIRGLGRAIGGVASTLSRLSGIGNGSYSVGGISDLAADLDSIKNFSVLGGLAKAAGVAAGAVAGIGAAAISSAGGLTALSAASTTVLIRGAEKYESALRKVTTLAETQGNGLGREDYDNAARDFAKYANTTRTEALEIAKILSSVGNIGQTTGSKIRKGTQIASEGFADLTRAVKMVPDFAAAMGGDASNPKELEKYAQNLRIAFSSWDNLQELASKMALFTEEQQKSIEKTKEMKGEQAALAEAFSYLPENLAGKAAESMTPLENAFANLQSKTREFWSDITDKMDTGAITQKLAEVFDKIANADFLSGMTDGLASFFAGFANMAIDALDWLVDKFVDVKDAVSAVFEYFENSAAANAFADALTSLGTAAVEVGSALLDIAGMALDFSAWIMDVLGLDDALKIVWNTIGGTIEVVSSLVSMAVDGWKLIIAGLQELWTVVSSPDAWGALGHGIAGAIEHFRQLYERATAFIGGIKNAIAEMFSAAGQVLGFVKGRAREAANQAGARASSAAANIGTGGAEVGAKIDKVTSAVDKMNKTVDGDIKSLKPVLQKWGGGTGGGGGGGRTRRGGGGGGGRGGKSEAEKQADRDAKNADRYLKSLREQAQEINRLTKLERLRYDIESGAIVLSDEQLKKAKEFAEIIDNRVRLQRQERTEIELATQALAHRREAEDASLRVSDIGMQYTMPDRLFSQMQELRGMALEYQRSMEDLNLRERQAVIGKSGEEIQEIRDKYNKIRDMAEEAYKERVNFWQMEVDAVEQFSHDIGANYQKGLLEVADWYSNLGKDIQSATESWASKAADALASFVRTGKMDFKSLANSILDDIARIASQQLISGLVSGVTSGWTSTGGAARSSGGGGFFGGLMSLFKGIFGFSGGGYTGAGGKYEPAGIVHAGEFVINAASTRRIAGEFGWDFLRKLNGYADGGYVTPLPSIVTSGGTGGVVRDADLEVNIYNQTDSQVTARRNSGGGVDVFIKQAVDAVASNISNGGNVASAIQSAYALNRGAGVQRVGF